MRRLFSSMGLAALLLLAMAAWFALGMQLTDSAALKPVFRQLNHLPLLQWPTVLAGAPAAAAWLLVLLGIVLLLMANTALCSWDDLRLPWRRRRWRSRRLMLLPIHLLTLAVFACHGIDLLFIHGHQGFSLADGQSWSLDGATVTLHRVEYRDDPRLLREDDQGQRSLGRITRRDLAQFDPRHNAAEVTLAVGDRRVRGQVRFMEPLVLGHHFLLLTDFRLPAAAVDDRPQGQFVLVDNPLINFFFLCYGLLFASLLLQAWRWWQTAPDRGEEAR